MKLANGVRIAYLQGEREQEKAEENKRRQGKMAAAEGTALAQEARQLSRTWA